MTIRRVVLGVMALVLTGVSATVATRHADPHDTRRVLMHASKTAESSLARTTEGAAKSSSGGGAPLERVVAHATPPRRDFPHFVLVLSTAPRDAGLDEYHASRLALELVARVSAG